MAAGLSPREAAAWSLVGRWVPIATMTRLAVQWHDAGLKAGDCEAWNRRGLMAPKQALAWMEAGYTAAQFDFLQAHCEADLAWDVALDEAQRVQAGIVDDWLTLRIHPDWACRFVVAGITDAGEAWTIWSTHDDHDALLGALNVLGGLRTEP
jgi:hypothetical protein